MRKVARTRRIKRRKISLLYEEVVKHFEEIVFELVDIGILCLW